MNRLGHQRHVDPDRAQREVRNALRLARKRAGLSQEDAAHELGWRLIDILKVEQGTQPLRCRGS
jgi:ribosome-binding protein aMBF1 (putative translation factor)